MNILTILKIGSSLLTLIFVTVFQIPNQSVPLIISHGDREKNQIAITFDADMTPKMLRKLQSGEIKSLYDQRITTTLEKNSIPATLFLTGMWAETYPDETKKLSQNPLFELGNHSYDHAGFTSNCYGLATVTDKNSEITKTQKIIFDLTGIKPSYFRFPGGCYTTDDLTTAKNNGLIPVQWDVISGDAYLKDPRKIIDRTVSKTVNGSIIVMHLDGGPNSPATASALPEIIKKLQAKGFVFVKLSQLLKQS